MASEAILFQNPKVLFSEDMPLSRRLGGANTWLAINLSDKIAYFSFAVDVIS